jgi:hypothetical protein
MKTKLLLGLMLCTSSWVFAQFAPQVGHEGTTAIHKDSSVFVNWATGYSVQRGWMNIADTTLGRAEVGDEASIPGKAGNGVVTLGDGGVAIVTFDHPIKNGVGFDFAVFENGFIDQTLLPGNAFLELAFVEVSSDGINYFRFPAESLTDTSKQCSPFEALNASKIHNLAGKYLVNYGTPFDLDELKNIDGLDINSITHVKIIDVVGSINPAYLSRDSKGRIINDPFPTAFASGGFDLDAVGVIHENRLSSVAKIFDEPQVRVFPNPAKVNQDVMVHVNGSTQIQCFDVTGRMIYVASHQQANGVSLSFAEAGIYFIKLINGNAQTIKRVVIQ